MGPTGSQGASRAGETNRGRPVKNQGMQGPRSHTNTHRHARRGIALRGSIALAGAMATLAAPALMSPAMAKPADPEPKVTICHRTNAIKNPYVAITVARSSADGAGGRGDHFNEHIGPSWTPDMRNGGDWGDIIPAIPGIHDGRNWDERGQAIWAAGCNPFALVDTDADDDDDGTPDADEDDLDGDGTPDASDIDDDGDGAPDTTDPDDDGDGTPDVTDPDADTDGDGDPNGTDPDNDGDGTPDADEDDLDGDGTPDASDIDDDGDGNPDSTDPDDDNDGTPEDASDPDSDTDGTPDATDTDDDNDGVKDSNDPDSNGDGLPENETQTAANTELPDDVVAGEITDIGAPGAVTDVGMQITYRVTCKPATSPRVSPRGDIDSGGKTPLCKVKTKGDQVTVRVISADPVKVRVVLTAAAIGTYEGYRKVVVYRVR